MRTMIGSAEEFVRLRSSQDKSEYDRAAQEEAPLGVWLEIVRDYPEMKIWVAANKTVPRSILEQLATDSDVAVRDAVARKRKAPAEILAQLARDPDSGVRFAVACNPNAPRAVLELLLEDDWDDLVREVKQRLATMP